MGSESSLWSDRRPAVPPLVVEHCCASKEPLGRSYHANGPCPGVEWLKSTVIQNRRETHLVEPAGVQNTESERCPSYCTRS